MKASLFVQDTLRGDASVFLPGHARAAWMLRNVTATVTRTPPWGLRLKATQAFGNHSDHFLAKAKEHVCRHVLRLDEIAQPCGRCTILTFESAIVLTLEDAQPCGRAYLGERHCCLKL